MSTHLKIWDRFADIDPKFTKPISGLDYSGTSPNPQYIIRCLTELFGPVGKGFGWQVVAEDFTRMGETTLHWCRIRFWWKDEDGQHECEQYGQTKAAFTTSAGKARVDEDAPKKSLTDAIVKAASHLGIAANIFLGRWDDQKYVSDLRGEFAEKDDKPLNLPKPKSSAELKRNGDWERVQTDLASDLADTHSLFALDKLRKDYRARAVASEWPRAWLETLANEFANAEEAIKKTEQVMAG